MTTNTNSTLPQPEHRRYSLSTVKIAGSTVGHLHPTYVIAEAGVNHNGDMDIAKKLIDVAHRAGADAVKFQTFRAEALNTRTAPKSTYHIETTGASGSWFDLLKSQEIKPDQHRMLIDYCDAKGITFLSTPYDFESAQLLADLKVPAIKVASTDANNIPFLRQLATLDVPIILSTAMCTLEEVKASYTALRESGCSDLILMHCTGSYPAPLEDTHLRTLETFMSTFDAPIGYSDHNSEIINPIAATALGSCIYEKHFTLSKDLPGPDHRASLTPDELTTMIRHIRLTETALGRGDKVVHPCEQENRSKLRKSVVSRVDLKAGDILTEDHLSIKRPGTGVEPKDWYEILGKAIKRDVPADSVLEWDMF